MNGMTFAEVTLARIVEVTVTEDTLSVDLESPSSFERWLATRELERCATKRLMTRHWSWSKLTGGSRLTGNTGL